MIFLFSFRFVILTGSVFRSFSLFYFMWISLFRFCPFIVSLDEIKYFVIFFSFFSFFPSYSSGYSKWWTFWLEFNSFVIFPFSCKSNKIISIFWQKLVKKEIFFQVKKFWACKKAKFWNLKIFDVTASNAKCKICFQFFDFSFKFCKKKMKRRKKRN